MLDKTNELFGSSQEFKDPKVIADGLEKAKTLLGYELVLQLSHLTANEKQDLLDGRTITQPIKSENFIFALNLCYTYDAKIINQAFNLIGKSTRYKLETYFNIVVDKQVHQLEIETAPDVDFIDFDDDTVEEVEIVEAIAEPLKAMAAGAGGR